MFNRRRIEQILGESMREIGILVFVFAPLDAVFAERQVDAEGLRWTVLFALVVIVAGTMLESGEWAMHTSAWIVILSGAYFLGLCAVVLRILRRRSERRQSQDRAR